MKYSVFRKSNTYIIVFPLTNRGNIGIVKDYDKNFVRIEQFFQPPSQVDTDLDRDEQEKFYNDIMKSLERNIAKYLIRITFEKGIKL